MAQGAVHNDKSTQTGKHSREKGFTNNYDLTEHNRVHTGENHINVIYVAKNFL